MIHPLIVASVFLSLLFLSVFAAGDRVRDDLPPPRHQKGGLSKPRFLLGGRDRESHDQFRAQTRKTFAPLVLHHCCVVIVGCFLRWTSGTSPAPPAAMAENAPVLGELLPQPSRVLCACRARSKLAVGQNTPGGQGGFVHPDRLDEGGSVPLCLVR